VQVFPYFYVRCGHVLPQGNTAVRNFLATFENSLNTVLQRLSSQQRNTAPSDGPVPAAHYVPQYQEAAPALDGPADAPGADQPAPQHVFAITLVKAASVYGYNPAEEPFLRVCLCDSQRALSNKAALQTWYATM
jgi:hypothetical protein